MMQIIKYTNEPKQRAQYLHLVEKLYGNQYTFEGFYRDLEKQCNPDCPTAKKQKRLSLAVMDGDVVIAHVTLIKDPREKADIGWFGFFECSDDQEIFHMLWKALREECATWDIKQLRGPINGSIWNQYRFVSGGDSSVPSFHGELLCKNYYHSLFQPLATNEVHYYSAKRDEFNNLIDVTKPFYEKAQQEGVRIEKIKNTSPELMQQLFTLARRIFESSWGCVPLDDEELHYLYSQDKLVHLDSLYTMRKRDDLIGFAVCFREGNSTLNIKTLAIDPAYQGKGLGNAFIHFVHADVHDRINRMIYALIRSENKVSKLPKDDAVVFRQYSAYEIDLS